MGLLNFFAQRKALSASSEVLEIANAGQFRGYQSLGGTNRQVVNAWEQAQSSSYAWMYRTQPAVRTTIDYIARNASQLPLKLFERVSDTEREPRGDHPAAETMRHPYESTTAKRWIFNFIADWLLYDNAYAVKFDAADRRRVLVRVPPHMMGLVSSSRFTVDGYRVHREDGSTYPETGMLAPDDVIHWAGYNPDDPRAGLSQLETLRNVLAEEAAAVTASTELLKSGLQKNGWIYRPLEAPDWGTVGREHFEQDLYNRVTGSAKRWPVLEEGMEIRDLGVTPKDAEMLEGRRFTTETVAAEYGLDGVPPADDDARKQFHSDVLAPLVEDLAEVLDQGLLRAEYAADDLYFEFDLNEKLRGDPIQRFQAITAAVGAPWLLRNEARAMENRPPVEGGDDLIVPLNVLEEGPDSPARPAPNVMPIQDPNKPPQDGSFRRRSAKAVMLDRRAAQQRRRDGYAADLAQIRNRLLARQEAALRSAKAVEAEDRWRSWDEEFAADLEEEIAGIVEREGDIVAQRLGLLAFDTRMTRNWTRAAAADIARQTNAATRRVTAGATKDTGDDLAATFDERRSESGSWATGTAGRAMNFAAIEAGKQSPTPRLKTWLVSNPANSAHPELDGATVAVGAAFTNGRLYPPYEHPGCACLVEIT